VPHVQIRTGLRSGRALHRGGLPLLSLLFHASGTTQASMRNYSMLTCIDLKFAVSVPSACTGPPR
jgi:hypothetical protein